MKGYDLALALASTTLPRQLPLAQLAGSLSIGVATAHESVKRLVAARLMSPEHTVIPANLLEFLVHGLKYVFPILPGGPTLGVPTGGSAPMFDSHEIPPPDPGPWVWPWPEGTVRGLTIEPLYERQPAAALKDPRYYELLALVDAIRAGRTRERNYAVKRFQEVLR